MEAAVGIDRLGVDRVEALRRLAVALQELGTEAARPAANGIGGETLEAIPPLEPQLELELALEDADENGGAEGKALCGKPACKVLKVGGAGERRADGGLRQPSHALGLDLEAVPIGEEVASHDNGRDDAREHRQAQRQPAQDRTRQSASRPLSPALVHWPG